MLRVSIQALDSNGIPFSLPDDPALAKRNWPTPVLRLRSVTRGQRVNAGRFQVVVTPEPFRFLIRREDRRLVQDLRVEQATETVVFSLGDGLIFGLRQGGMQFDRRQKRYSMRASHAESVNRLH
jgi:hypothetical protein